MVKKENIDGWIDYVYAEWLFEANKQSSIQGSRKIKVEQMKDALQQKKFDDVKNYIERLKKISDYGDADNRILHKTEGSEILLECAITIFKIGNNEEALNLLGAALGGFASDWHYRAVSLWLKGCIQWLIPKHEDNAIQQWELSKNLFEKFGPKSQTYANWYKQRTEEMYRAIAEATKNDAPLAYTDTQNPLLSFSSHYPHLSLKSAGSIKSHKIRFLSIIGEIPAGQTYNIAAPIDDMEVEEVHLLDERYRIVNLRGSSIIKIHQEMKYYILKVRGTSMNAATPEPIENGDYVLMRSQETATHMDIVAAEIVGPDTGATLKRYRFERNAHLLYPESSDPEWQKPINPREDWRLGKDFHIRGLALAVLKKIQDE